jgi:hypothetical protein
MESANWSRLAAALPRGRSGGTLNDWIPPIGNTSNGLLTKVYHRGCVTQSVSAANNPTTQAKPTSAAILPNHRFDRRVGFSSCPCAVSLTFAALHRSRLLRLVPAPL